MKLPKLTAFLFVLPLIILFSCKSTEEIEDDNIYYTNITMTGAQEVPPSGSSATGTIEGNYNRLTRTFTYKVTYSGISGTGATAAHIHGLAEPGINAPVLQTFAFPSTPATSGTYSGTLLIDGVKFTEENLLAGRYYINIHSVAKPGGEIRGQLFFTKKQ